MVVRSIAWILLPGVVFGLLAMLLPDPGPAPWWRRGLRRVLHVVRARRDRSRGRRRSSRSAEPDPFEVLAVQMRLAAVAAQLRSLEFGDQRTWALAKRLEATQVAYDDLLAEACRLAGITPDVPPPGVRRRSEPERLSDELALAQRGWSW